MPSLDEPTDPFVVDSNQPAEQVIARIRRSARILVLPSILAIVIAGLAGYFGNVLPENWMRWAVWGGAAVLLIIGWLIPLAVWLGQRVIVTTKRVVIIRGVFTRNRQEVLLSRIHDVTLRQGIGQRAARSGDVLLGTGAERAIRLHDVPDAALISAALTDLVHSNMSLTAQIRRDELGARFA